MASQKTSFSATVAAALICFVFLGATLAAYPFYAYAETETPFEAANVNEVLTANAGTGTVHKVSSYDELVAAVASMDAGTIVLKNDITYGADKPTFTIPSGKEITLNLNSHTLARDLTAPMKDGCVVIVRNGATLRLRDGVGVKGLITGGNNSNPGGGIYNEGTLEIVGCNINGNKTESDGGGIYNAGNATLSTTNLFIENNTARGLGGGIANSVACTATILGGRIHSNTALPEGSGGGVFNTGTMTLRDVEISNCLARDGGAIRQGATLFDDAKLIVSNCSIHDNVAQKYNNANSGCGGAISVEGYLRDIAYSSVPSPDKRTPIVTIEKNTRIFSNSADTAGGGVYLSAYAAITVNSSTITGNEVLNSADVGGGIHCETKKVIDVDGSEINYAAVLFVAGKPVIKDNKAKGAESNIYIKGEVGKKTVVVADSLEDGAHIGVSCPPLTLAKGKYYCEITTGYSNVMGDADPSEYFFSDSSDATAVGKNGEVGLVKNVPYIDIVDGQRVEKVCCDYRLLSEADYTPNNLYECFPWTDGWWVVDDDRMITDRVIMTSSDVKLILTDGHYLYLSLGINVSRNQTLSIYGQKEMTGKLEAYGYYNSMWAGDSWGRAAIGVRGYNEALGTIKIYGGRIYAHGGHSGAGIGKGSDKGRPRGGTPSHDTSGALYIYDGDVTAVGGAYAAGIGGGWDTGSFYTEINGGTVHAIGSDEGGSGIGAGASGFMGDKPIVINGGNVTAIGGNAGAPGVGAVTVDEDQDKTNPFNLILRGGTLHAYGTSGNPGINAGKYGSVYLCGGTVDALDSRSGSARIAVTEENLKMGQDPDNSDIATDYRVAANAAGGDGAAAGAQLVDASARTSTLQNSSSSYKYVRAELCTEHEFVQEEASDTDTGYVYRCRWCGETCDACAIRFEPGDEGKAGEGGIFKHVTRKGAKYTLPTQEEVGYAYDGTLGQKYLTGWLIDGVAYNAGETIEVTKSTVATAQWSLDWKLLQRAIDESEDGDVVWLLQDIVAEDDDTTLVVPAGKNITINLNGYKLDRHMNQNASSTEGGSAVKVLGELTVKDRKRTGSITGGNASYGGGLLVGDGGVVNLKAGNVSGNKATYGGGVYVDNGGTCVLEGDAVSGNEALGGGGVYVERGGTFVENDTIANVSDNTARGYGGGIYVAGTATVTDGNINRNSSYYGGAAFVGAGGTLSLAIEHEGNLCENWAGTACGIYVSEDSTFELSGYPAFKDNMISDGQTCDVYLEKNETITVPALLDPFGTISVLVYIAPTSTTPVVLTDGLEGRGSYEKFVSADERFCVGRNADGEAILGAPVTVSFDPGEGEGSMDSRVVPVGDAFELPESKFTAPRGLEFVGWKAEGSSDVNGAGKTIAITGNTKLIAQYTKDYNVWVGDVRVTAANAGNVLGEVDDAGMPTVSYIPSSSVLVLNDPTITGERSAAKIYADGVDLTVTGSATIKGGDRGVFVENGSLWLGGDLDISAAVYGVQAANVTVYNGEITISSTVRDRDYGIRLWPIDGTITVKNSIERLDVSASTPMHAGSVVIGNHLYKEVDEDDHKVIVPYIISGKITWDDDDNAHNARPDSVDVDLWAGQYVMRTVTVTADSDWAWQVQVPYAIGGQRASYIVKGDKVENYHSTTDGLDITYSYYELVDATVTVCWDDAEDQDGERPESLAVNLTANGEPRKTVMLTADEGWTATLSGLEDRDANGNEIAYEWSLPDAPPGYSIEARTDGRNATFTYLHTPEETEAVASIAWADEGDRSARPESVTVTLLRQGVRYWDCVLNEENGWTVAVEGLPRYDAGEEVAYSWVQDSIALGGRYRTSTKTDGALTTFTNTITGQIDFTVSKKWDDATAPADARPGSVTVRLRANNAPFDGALFPDAAGNADTHPAAVELSGESWSYTWAGLPKYDAAGKEVAYSVSEDSVEHYMLSSEPVEDGVALTNVYRQTYRFVHACVVWVDGEDADGNRPGGVEVSLVGDTGGAPTSIPGCDVKTLDEDNEWACLWHVPTTMGGLPVDYSLGLPEAPEGYSCEVAGDMTAGFVVTYRKLTSCEVAVTWDDGDDQDGVRPESLPVTLSADGKPAGTITLTGADGWSGVLDGLNKYSLGGAPVDYEWQAGDLPDGYEVASVERSGAKTTLVIAREPEEATVAVAAHWNDGDNADGARPASVVARIVRPGADSSPQVLREVVLDEDNGWKAEVGGLPAFEGGERVSYDVQVDQVQGYDLAVQGSVASGFTVSCDRLVNPRVVMTWDDYGDLDRMRPESVVATLMAGDEEITARTLDERCGWTASVQGLRLYDEDGAPIAYRWESATPEGYQTLSETDDATSYFWHYHQPLTTSASVTVTWDDADDQDGVRPDSLTANLMADGEVYATVVLSDENGWTAKLKGLLQRRDGKDVTYQWQEPSTPAAYSADNQVDGTSATFQYSHAPEVTESAAKVVWADGDDCEGARPDSVTLRLLKNGDLYKEFSVAEGDGWQAAGQSLPMYQAGERVTWSWEQDAQTVGERYSSTSRVDGANTTFTNVITGTTSFTVRKAWDDDGDNDGVRPDSVKVQLRAGNAPVADSAVEISEGDGWSHTWDGLDKYDASGREIAYSATEVADPGSGYVLSGSEPFEGGVKLTNEHAIGVRSVRVFAVWNDGNDADGARPTGVRVTLAGEAGGEPVEVGDATATLDEQHGWSHAWGSLPVKHDGADVAYTIAGSEFLDADGNPIRGFRATVSGDADAGFTIRFERLTDSRVVVEWDDVDNRDGLRPGSVEATLVADGKEVAARTLSAEGGWAAAVEGLDKYDADGNEIAYSWESATPEGYGTWCETYKSTTYFWHYHEPLKTTASVFASWDDAGDEDGLRPATQAITLLRSVGGSEPAVVGEYVLSAQGGWKLDIGSLPAREGGADVAYTVQAASVEGYDVSVTGDTARGFVVSNAHVPIPTHEITYDLNGGTYDDSFGPIVEVYKEGKVIALHEAPMRKGYAFLCWKDADSERQPNDSYTVEGDRTFVAQWQKDPEPTATHKVTYDLNGGTYDGSADPIVEEHEEGEAIALHEAPTRDGYTFLGWDSEDYQPGDSYTVEGDRTFKAQWQKDPEPVVATHKVTYDLNGGTYDGSADPIVEEHEEGEVIAVHAAPTREGYAFLYWKGSEYRPGDDYIVTEDHTLVAQWQKDPEPAATYKVTYDLGGGAYDGKSEDVVETYDAGAAMTLREAPTRDGYTFLCWMGPGRDFQPGDAFAVTSDCTFVAKWQEDPEPAATYKITYDLDGGAYDGKSEDVVETYDAGAVITLREAPTRDGYTFLGWDSEDYQPGDSYTVAGDHTFTAQWRSESGTTPSEDKGGGSNAAANADTSTTKDSRALAPTGDSMPTPWQLAGLVLASIAVSGFALFKRRKDLS